MSTLHPEPDAADIAIIGMAGRFPGARNVDELWRNVRGKVESIRRVSEEECLAAGLDPALVRDPSFVRAVAELEDIEGFDAAFFDMPPREAELTDPQQRVFLECAWTALEHAGYSPRDYPGRIGVFGGAMLNTYLLFNIAANRSAFEAMHPLQINVGNGADFLATRVSYKLNLRGPSHSVQSACSTSLVAVHVACQSILNEECDMALAGGVAINVGHRHGYRHLPGGMASPDGHCRAFDARGQGTIFGSGGAVVVLKPLRAALADGDFVHAVIKGSAINNDGSQKAGYTAPSALGQAEVIAEAIAAAGVSPDTIACVEAHGTGTPLGDPIEIDALTRAFRADTPRTGYCAIGSVKTNVGHLDAGAGVTGLIKMAQALRHRELPPSLHFEKPNPQIDFASSPFYVNAELRPWERGAQPRRAAVSAFGVGGTNAHAVLEEAPAQRKGSPSRKHQLLVLSARTRSALDAAAALLATHLEENPDAHLPDVAHTLQVGRQRFAHRCFVVCEDTAGAVHALRSPSHRTGEDRADRPLAILFPGQGAQHVGMAAALYRGDEPLFRAEVDRCAELFRPHLGLDLRDVLFPSSAEQAAEKLAETAITQPALFTIEYALAQLWLSWGIAFECMLGHSIGEYVAACLAGVFDLPDAVRVVAERGRAMQELAPGAMLAVPLSEEETAPYLHADLSLAAVNAETQCVLSGTVEAVEEASRKLLAAGIQVRRLPAKHAFHSPMMQPAADRLAACVRSVRRHAPTRPFLSNVTGTWITQEQATSPEYWAEHLCKTVRFADGLTTLLRDERRALLEVGPGQTLTRLARRHPAAAAHGRAVIASLPDPDAAHVLGALGELWQAGVRVDWRSFGRNETRRRIPLPTYAFERKRFWLEPARSVRPPDAIVPSTAEERRAEEAPSEARTVHPRPAGLKSPYVPPRNALERSLAAFWEQALGVGPIGIHDSFFELGGDSLAAVQLSAHIKGALGVEIPAVSLFEGLTLEALAKLVAPEPRRESNGGEGEAAAAQDQRRKSLALQRARRGGDDDS